MINSDGEFMASYQEALASYQPSDLETIFATAGLSDPGARAIGIDFLAIAGAFYLRRRGDQAATASRSEVLRQLRRAQKSSRDLADSLMTVLQDRSMIGAVMDASRQLRQAYPDDQTRERDSFRILDAIFPLSGSGEGFRYEGLAHALNLLALCFASVEAEAIQKPDIGRIHALRPWSLLMVTYWLETFGEPPRTGHYDKETAEYSSTAIAALTQAAQCLDKELTSRLVVKALTEATASLEQSALELGLLLSIGFSELIASGEAHAPNDALLGFTGIPADLLSGLQSLPLPEGHLPRERAIVSKDEFFETLKSSEAGKMLLQGLMANDDD